jgi:hypothetical protein
MSTSRLLVSAWRSTSFTRRAMLINKHNLLTNSNDYLQSRHVMPIHIVPSLQQRLFTSHGLFMTTVDEDVAETTKTLESTWNVSGLKKEVQRVLLRTHKKVGKAVQRVQKAQEEVDRLTSSDASLQELEACPDLDMLQVELSDLQKRLDQLNQLESLLKAEKGGTRVLSPETAGLALDLGVDDSPPVVEPRGPKKPKGPRERESSRLPYRRYFSFGNVEIRVGKKAEDNDALSLVHRDDSDGWMHAAGCPGSHVVIRSQSASEEVLLDAAALAARHSKCVGNVIPVSLTQCRHLRKPAGAKAGLLQLIGPVRTIKVDMKKAQERLDRLDQTVLVN